MEKTPKNRTIIFMESILIGALLFSSCSIKNEITLASDGSGTATTNIKLENTLTEYLQSLAELTGNEESSESMFDIEEIKKEMGKNKDIVLKKIESKNSSSLNMEISFDDIQKLIKESEKELSKKVISFNKLGKEKEIKIYMDIDNFKDIAPLFPIIDEPLFQTFGPLENQGITEEEYLEMMEYALGDGGAKLIKESIITTKINIKGSLISQRGGTISGNAVIFRTPLIRLLMLDEPIEYSIKFK